MQQYCRSIFALASATRCCCSLTFCGAAKSYNHIVRRYFVNHCSAASTYSQFSRFACGSGLFSAKLSSTASLLPSGLCCSRISVATMPSGADALVRCFDGVHMNCRNSNIPYLRSDPPVYRVELEIPDVPWSKHLCDDEYSPADYSSPALHGKDFADPPLGDAKFKPQWNQIDGDVDRRSFVVDKYKIDGSGRPMNPIGRTGLRGRGVLGKWGPNHAADPIVTRWKRDDKGDVVRHIDDANPVLQFVAIERKDSKQWAIPGGMVDPGETVSETLRREFLEEAFDSKATSGRSLSEEDKAKIEQQLQYFFAAENGLLVYKGYVDDPRNTDNAWMETVAVNYHDEEGCIVGQFDLQAGDDATNVEWMDISADLRLYASHRSFVLAVAQHRHAHV